MIYLISFGLLVILVALFYIYKLGKANDRLDAMADAVKRAQEATQADHNVISVSDSDLNSELSDFSS